MGGAVRQSVAALVRLSIARYKEFLNIMLSSDAGLKAYFKAESHAKCFYKTLQITARRIKPDSCYSGPCLCFPLNLYFICSTKKLNISFVNHSSAIVSLLCDVSLFSQVLFI